MTHKHCDKCFISNCSESSSCLLISCPHGCFARMHECKREDHEYICPNVYIPCLNKNYGCPLTLRRSDLTRHLRVCPASIIVCSFTYNHEYHFNNLENSVNMNLVQTIARRDNIWSEHLAELDKKRQIFLELRNQKTKQPIEHIIRSEKYPYITMRECMLSKGNDVICSACRKHLRQLEENEDQRLSELSEEDQNMMANFSLQYDTNSNQTTTPSLVKMSSTLINSTDISIPTLPSSSQSDPDLSQNEPLPIISDFELPFSHIYRLNYFSSNEHVENFSSFNKSPRFSCLALCRRDEIEQHWHIHLHIDCILNTSLIQQCPKSQYGCPFQYERLEPCQTNGQPIRIRFDEKNDAIAFDWYPSIIEEKNEQCALLDLPSEILEKILLKLDSLSLRNTSFVCRRLRALCQDILPSRGIVITEYERNSLLHGDITWIERKKHWLFTNTSSSVPKWQLKTSNKFTSLNQHLITCSFGETKDLQNEPPFPLLAWTDPKAELKSIE